MTASAKNIMGNLSELPKKIKVKIVREKNNVLFADLVDLGIFTEADSFPELIFNVNDLIYSFYDIPEEDRFKIWYRPPFVVEKAAYKKRSEFPLNPVLFHVLTEPQRGYEFK